MSKSPDTKWCPDCRSELPSAEFTRDVRRKDGLSFYCRDCRVLRDESSRRRRRGPAQYRTRPRDLVVGPGEKWCPDCNEVKALAEFRRNRAARSGVSTYCRVCHLKRDRASVETNGGRRNYHLRRRYGITAEHADRMFAEQGGLCAICREAPAEHVDHDHASNRVRGLLCFNCNGALGQFRDRRDLMLRAAMYLEGGPRAVVDTPPVEFGMVLGATERPRPADEPAPV